MRFKALLIDLDNTLIFFDEDEFLLSYARSAYNYYFDLFDESTFFQKVIAATRQLILNDGSVSNVEAFTNHFISDVPQLSFEECVNRFKQFYQTDFHKLSGLVTPAPYGRQLIQHTLKAGLQVTIATNPIFPNIATKHRLAWANLADLDITLFTHAENMSYCKPRSEYYARILTLLNRKPEECLMAGNDPVTDMAASALGIKTFLVTMNHKKGFLGLFSKQLGRRTDEEISQPKYKIDGRGSLQDLEQFLLR